MMKRLIALLLALMLCAPAVLAASDAAPRVLATVEGKEILQSEADQIMPTFVSFQYVESAADYQTVVKYLVQQEVLRRKVADMQFDQFTAEEETALRNEAAVEWEEGIASYVSYYLSEDTEDARAKAREEAIAFYNGRGMTEESLFESRKFNASVDKMRTYLVGDYQPAEEEINTVFQTVGEQYRAQYEGNVGMYETMTQLSGQKSWYVPEGYRGITHILLRVDSALTETYTATQAAFEEQERAAETTAAPQDAATAAPQDASATAAPETVTEPVTAEQVEEARKAVLAAKQKEIDDIYARLAKGESFEALIKEYGEDPGMEQEEYLANGYSVHKDSAIYDPAFTKGAFSEKMAKVGDVSDPVVSGFGIHILYYLRDVPSGLVMTDEIREEIASYLRARKEAEAFEKAITDWEATMTIAYNQENIDAASKEAADRIAQEEAEAAAQSGPEAVPSDEGTPSAETAAPAEATAAPAN